MGDSIDDDFGPVDALVEGTTYRVSAYTRLFQLVFLIAGMSMCFCIVADCLIVLFGFAIVPHLAVAFLADFAAQSGWPGPVGVAGLIVGGLGSLFVAAFATWIMLHFALAMPSEITVAGDGLIAFRSWWKTIELRPEEIRSVVTGGWSDPSGFRVVLRHKGGKIVFFNQFRDFVGFLAQLKELNPAVEIEGF